MSEILLNQLIEKLDQVILGRRDIISEIEKLKDAIVKIQSVQNGNTIIQITNAVNEIKVFMSKSTNVLSELNNNMQNLQNLISSLYNVFDTLLNTTKIPESFTPTEISTKSLNNLTSTGYQAKIPAPIRSPSEVASIAIPEKIIDTAGVSDFNLIISIAKSNNPAIEIAIMLEKIRTKLERENPLNPILFELSMESRRLKSLGNTPLDAYNLQILIEKIQKWMS